MHRTRWQNGGLVAGIVVFLLLVAVDSPLHRLPGRGSQPARAAAVSALMCVWWLTEALPIHVTACVPLLLYPACGVFGGGLGKNLRESAYPYVHSYIFLFMGGMCIAAAMQQWDLHRRIALAIMRRVGTDPRRLLAGFLVATAFISLWISNTATATMMVPIGIAVIAQLEARAGRRLAHYGMAVMLAIAYAANVGGIGTKIGTAPNAQFALFMAGLGVEVTFVKFMAVGLPFVLLFLPVVWLALWRIGRADAPEGSAGAEALAHETARLGPMKPAEWIVLAAFGAAAALWIAGAPLTAWAKPRLAPWLKLTGAHVEGTVAMAAALTLVLARSGGRQVLELASLRHVPWSTLLLLGGSFSMAAGIEKSGLSNWLGARLGSIQPASPFGQVVLASLATVALSALASNTATTSIMLVLLKDAVSRSHLSTVLFASTLSASCDFALPVGTPPNAIVFGSGYVTIPRMARTGVVLDIAAALVAATWCWLVVRWVL